MTRATEAAAQLLEELGIQGPPVTVEDIARKLRIAVVRSEADWQESGFLLRDGQTAIIGVNSNNATVRQRFTIAHELGHYRLHKGKQLIVDKSVVINKRDAVSSLATDKEEIEANQFAAALLMPRPMVKDAVQRRMNNGVGSRDELIAGLADEFEVSTEAMGYRLINLGLLRS